jgi:hypothetical protein
MWLGKFPDKIILLVLLGLMGLSMGTAAAADQRSKQLADQAKACIAKGDELCNRYCIVAEKNPDNRSIVDKCNALYQRFLASGGEPIAPKPEESMTLEARIALMKDKAAYCQSKKSSKLKPGIRRLVDNCIIGCADTRVTDMRYPLERRQNFVRDCEAVYYGVVKEFGK